MSECTEFLAHNCPVEITEEKLILLAAVFIAAVALYKLMSKD